MELELTYYESDALPFAPHHPSVSYKIQHDVSYQLFVPECSFNYLDACEAWVGGLERLCRIYIHIHYFRSA